MSDPNPKPETLVKRESVAEYIPFGAKDKIKLSVAIVQNYVAVKTKTGKTCSERDAVRFIAMCQAKGMNPFEGDCYLIGYDSNSNDGPSFALITAHQTYLKRAEMHPEFDGMKSGVIVKDANNSLIEVEGDFYDEGQTVVGGWATVFFKTRKQPMHKRLRLARFQKGFGVWREDAAGMICKCAEADALRSSFPTMLGGLYLREEVEREQKEPVVVAPQFSRPALFSPPDQPANGGEHQAPVEAEQPKQQAPEGFNPLKAVRNLCKQAGISETKLLEFMDAGVGTLDEVNGETLRSVSEQWKDVVSQIKGGNLL